MDAVEFVVWSWAATPSTSSARHPCRCCWCVEQRRLARTSRFLLSSQWMAPCTREFSARHAYLLLIVALAASLGGCGRDYGTPPAAASPFIHSPPVKELSRERLRALSMECETYIPSKTQRGPYDAAYCQSAIDAWADAPLESVGVIEPSTRDRNAPP